MTLGRKLTIAATLGIAFVLIAHGVLRAQHDVELLRRDISVDHRGLAHALALSVAAVARRSGPERARELIDDVNLRESRVLIRWVPSRSASPGDGIEQTESSEHGDVIRTRVPLQLGPAERGYVELRESLDVEDERVRDTLLRTIVTLLATVAICGFIILTFASLLVTKPMSLVLEKLRRVGQGDLGSPLVLEQRDEMGTLATAVNTMCEQLASARDRAERETARRLATLEQLRHADRLSTVGQLASGIAHELGTPLNVIAVCAGSVASGESAGEEARHDARIIREQTERMTGILQQLLDFARPRAPAKHAEDLDALARSTVSFLDPLAQRRQVRLSVEGARRAVVAQLDAGQIQQVLTNLIVNGIQAVPAGGGVRVRVERDGGRASIAVEDDGPGMAPELRDHVFEPFFTTKDVGEGTGLGLSVAYGIVAEHGGQLRVESEAGQGTRFVVELPLEEDG